VDAFYIDWSRVVSSIPGSPLLIFQGNSGFTLTIDYPVVGSAEAQEHANRWILALYT
jgi:hypothetical protein